MTREEAIRLIQVSKCFRFLLETNINLLLGFYSYFFLGFFLTVTMLRYLENVNSIKFDILTHLKLLPEAGINLETL